MKNGVRIVNAARGPLIDEDALIDGLKSGKIAGAALDVFSVEPLSPDSPLLQLDNVVITPHLAASTVEAQRDVGTQIVEQMLDALRELDFRNALNMPIVDAGLHVAYFERSHQFKLDRGKQNYVEEVAKFGFHVGAGFSMFILDVITYYNYLNNNEYISFNLRATIPIFVTF